MGPNSSIEPSVHGKLWSAAHVEHSAYDEGWACRASVVGDR